MNEFWVRVLMHLGAMQICAFYLLCVAFLNLSNPVRVEGIIVFFAMMGINFFIFSYIMSSLPSALGLDDGEELQRSLRKIFLLKDPN